VSGDDRGFDEGPRAWSLLYANRREKIGAHDGSLTLELQRIEKDLADLDGSPPGPS